MKMQNVALSDIVPNPWRDVKLYPIDADHVADLGESIHDHGFFGGVKGRRRNGKVEIACGHARIEAARKAKLDTVPIFIDDMDDDEMLRLMTDENATQSGTNPGAVMNEVAAVTRRLIDGLFQEANSGTIVHEPVKQAFESKLAVEQAIGRLKKRLVDGAADIPIGINVITRYLGQGHPEKSHRGEREIRGAITALKQCGRYDTMVDEAVRKYAQPVAGASAKDTAVAKTNPRRAPVLDERCANIFPNEHQFSAFRDAVTTPAAQRAIPVAKQYNLAKEIMSAKHIGKKKQIGAPYIKAVVQGQVQDYLKAQRKIDKDERESYLREQREERIDNELRTANASLRSLGSALARMNDLADEFPGHPKLGGFSARLDTLVGAIQQFSKKLK